MPGEEEEGWKEGGRLQGCSVTAEDLNGAPPQGRAGQPREVDLSRDHELSGLPSTEKAWT